MKSRRPATIADRLRRMRKISAIDAAAIVAYRDLQLDGAEAIEEPFLDWLAVEFAIDDRVALREAIETAAHSYEGAKRVEQQWKEQRRTLVSQLDALRNICDLKWILAEELARPGEPYEQAAERVGAPLAEIQAAARSAPRTGLARGSRRNLPLNSMVRVLADFWTEELGRKFTSDQNWRSNGDSGPREPHVEAERFCFEVVRYLSPGEEAQLRTLAREAYLRNKGTSIS